MRILEELACDEPCVNVYRFFILAFSFTTHPTTIKLDTDLCGMCVYIGTWMATSVSSLDELHSVPGLNEVVGISRCFLLESLCSTIAMSLNDE